MSNTNEQSDTKLDKILQILKNLENKMEQLENMLKDHTDIYFHEKKLDYS